MPARGQERHRNVNKPPRRGDAFFIAKSPKPENDSSSDCYSRRALTRRMPPSANRRQWNLWEVDNGEVTWRTGPRHRSPGEWRQIGRSISINKRAWLGSCHRDSYLQANDGNRGAQSYLAKSTEKRLGQGCNVPNIEDWGRERVKTTRNRVSIQIWLAKIPFWLTDHFKMKRDEREILYLDYKLMLFSHFKLNLIASLVGWIVASKDYSNVVINLLFCLVSTECSAFLPPSQT